MLAKNVDKAFVGRARDIYHQEAFSNLNDPKAKLRTYGLMKHDIGREGYLVQIKNTKLRQKLTKFRLSNHKLMIELGRHTDLDKDERICQICHEEVEDEIHFMIKCKFYDALRKPLFDHCSQLRPQFLYYSDKEKFQYVMSTPAILNHMSKFLDDAMKDREIHLEVSSSLNCILEKICKTAP